MNVTTTGTGSSSSTPAGRRYQARIRSPRAPGELDVPHRGGPVHVGLMPLQPRRHRRGVGLAQPFRPPRVQPLGLDGARAVLAQLALGQVVPGHASEHTVTLRALALSEGSTPARRPGQSGHHVSSGGGPDDGGGGDLGRKHRPRRAPTCPPSPIPCSGAITLAAVVVLVAVDFAADPPPARGDPARGRRLVGLLRRAAARLRRLGLGRVRLGARHRVPRPGTWSRSRCRSTTCSSSCSCWARSRSRRRCTSGCCCTGSSARSCCAPSSSPLGAAALEAFSFTFLVFGADPRWPPPSRSSGTPGRATTGRSTSHRMRRVRLLRRVVPVTGDYDGTRMLTRHGGRRALTPLASRWSPSSRPTSSSPSTPCPRSTASPATRTSSSPPTRSPCSACARCTSCWRERWSRLVHLGYGLAVILAVIGVKLVLHWAHGVWPAVPEIPTLAGLAVHRRRPRRRHGHQPARDPEPTPGGQHWRGASTRGEDQGSTAARRSSRRANRSAADDPSQSAARRRDPGRGADRLRPAPGRASWATSPP